MQIYKLTNTSIVDTANNIAMYLHNYQTDVNALKNVGYKVVGFARKSLGNESNETQLRLLRLMRDCQKGWSLVESIVVSFSSKANEPMNKRDKPKTSVFDEMEVDGDTNGNKIITFRFDQFHLHN